MQPEISYEVHQFLTRSELECLQLVRRSMRDTIVARAKQLALRPIDSVEMGVHGGRIEMRVNQTSFPDFAASVLHGDFEIVVRRLQHVFIKSFRYEVSGNPLMEYWMEHETEFLVDDIDLKGVDKLTDYGRIDAQIRFLHPQAFSVFVDDSSWNEGGNGREYVDLLSREAFRNTIPTCVLFVNDNAPPPVSWILGASGYRHYKLHDYNGDGCFPSDWFDSFIDSFVRGECVNEKLESVFVSWLFKGEPSAMPKRLREPSESDVCIPREDLVLRRISDEHKATRCDLFSFTSTDQKRRVDVYMWVVKGIYRGIIFKF